MTNHWPVSADVPRLSPNCQLAGAGFEIVRWMHDRDAGTGGVTQYRGDNSHGDFNNNWIFRLKLQQSVDICHQPPPLPARCQLAVFAGPREQRRVYSRDDFQGNTSHYSQTVFILQIILEFSSFLWLFPFWKSNRVERRCILLFSFYKFIFARIEMMVYITFLQQTLLCTSLSPEITLHYVTLQTS